MANLIIPITVAQLVDLARQLSPEERRTLIDNLLAERYENVLAESDRRGGARAELPDHAIQAEVDAVRQQRRQERQRAAGG